MESVTKKTNATRKLTLIGSQCIMAYSLKPILLPKGLDRFKANMNIIRVVISKPSFLSSSAASCDR